MADLTLAGDDVNVLQCLVHALHSVEGCLFLLVLLVIVAVIWQNAFCYNWIWLVLCNRQYSPPAQLYAWILYTTVHVCQQRKRKRERR